MDVCGYNSRHNHSQSYLHVTLSDNYKAFYQQKADKGDTETTNNENRYDYAVTWRAARHRTARGSTDQKEPTQAPDIMPQYSVTPQQLTE